MQVVLFYDLLNDLSDSRNEQEQVRNVMNTGISGVLVRTIRYHMCIRSTVSTIKMSGHHSRYRDNYKSQVYHALC